MSRRRKQVVIDCAKMIKEHGGCYFDQYWAREFAAQTKCREEDAASVIRCLFNNTPKPKMGGWRAHVNAMRDAAERITGWYNMAQEYPIKKLSDFVASHDPACVWAVLLGRGL